MHTLFLAFSPHSSSMISRCRLQSNGHRVTCVITLAPSALRVVRVSSSVQYLCQTEVGQAVAFVSVKQS